MSAFSIPGLLVAMLGIMALLTLAASRQRPTPKPKQKAKTKRSSKKTSRKLRADEGHILEMLFEDWND